MPKWLDKKHADALEAIQKRFENLSDDLQELQDIQDELEEKGGNMEEKFPAKAEAYTTLASEIESIKDEIMAKIYLAHQASSTSTNRKFSPA